MSGSAAIRSGAGFNGETMNLRSSRPSSEAETKPSNDPKAPHLFQEIGPGNRGCALCSRGRADARHKVEEEEQPGGRWGF
jgi:hypothetical protein